VISARFHQRLVNLADVAVVVFGSFRPDGRHAELRVQRRLLGAIVVQLLLDAIPFLFEHGQPFRVDHRLIFVERHDVIDDHGIELPGLGHPVLAIVVDRGNEVDRAVQRER